MLELPRRRTKTAVVEEDGGRGERDGARRKDVHPEPKSCKGGTPECLGSRTHNACLELRRSGGELLGFAHRRGGNRTEEGHLLRRWREGTMGKTGTLGAQETMGSGLYGGEALLATLAPVDVDASSPT